MPRPTPPTPARGRSLPGIAARVSLLVLVATAFVFVASRPESEPQSDTTLGDKAAAHRAVEAMLDPESGPDPRVLLPDDFTEVTGATAGTEPFRDGTTRAVHVGGGCSAPWGEDNTRWGFGTACRAHDLGYDLLRYSERKGAPLDPEVRAALDDRLSADMKRICALNPQGSRTLCESVAAVYTAGLDVNSWHQRWGPPVGEPIAPLLAGVAMIGSLLSYRLRDHLRARPRTAERGRDTDPLPGGAAPTPDRLWTLVGVGAVAVLMLGEVALSLTRWAGVAGEGLWPLTWVAQTTVVFFFAAGHVNAASWRAVTSAGGGCRDFLSHRLSRLSRLALVFALVAFAMPIGLELLRVPQGTIDAVVRLALHPLWLLGLYLLTVVSTPVMLALHRRAPRLTPTALLLSLGGVAWLSGAAWVPGATGPGDAATGEWLPGHATSLLAALLAQHLAFAHRDGFRPGRPMLLTGAFAATAALTAGAVAGLWPAHILGVAEAPAALAGPVPAVLLVGLVQLGVLGLVRTPLARFGARPAVLRSTVLAARAPMSLYLLFLAATLLLVAAVYLPGRLGADPAWFLRPRALGAVALLAVPAVVVFVRFERHGWRGPPQPAWSGRSSGPHHALSHLATFAGFVFAVTGVFGFALTTLGTDVSGLGGVLLDPVQSLVQLLLGMSLLHSARTDSTRLPWPWLLTTLACVPPLLSVTASAGAPPLPGLVAHLAAGALGLVGATWTTMSALTSLGRRVGG